MTQDPGYTTTASQYSLGFLRVSKYACGLTIMAQAEAFPTH